MQAGLLDCCLLCWLLPVCYVNRACVTVCLRAIRAGGNQRFHRHHILYLDDVTGACKCCCKRCAHIVNWEQSMMMQGTHVKHPVWTLFAPSSSLPVQKAPSLHSA